MTKQECTAKAYGESGIDCTNLDPNEDGWIRFGSKQYDINLDIFEDKQWLGYYFYRPKSLQGIEHNNNWIKIESEEDLPKESINYWVMQDDGRINTIKEYFERKEYSDIKSTHYQPIEKPKPPIY